MARRKTGINALMSARGARIWLHASYETRKHREDFHVIRMLPEGIGVLPLFLNIREGTTDEFKRATAPYEPLIQQLAEAGCDLIHPEGAPPFMLLGFKGEAAHLEAWEKTYKVPFFTSGSNHV